MEEILIEDLKSGVEYTIEANIIDIDRIEPVEAISAVKFRTQKCFPPGKFPREFLFSLSAH
jgi:hypothetical protein